MAFRGATKGVSLIKQGWNEIPEIMCCFGLIGSSLVAFAIGSYGYDRDTHHRYKLSYTVVRDTDAKKQWVEKNIYN